MKLIIDINEETLKEINRCGLFLNPRDKENLVNSIKHGTPIPEGQKDGKITATELLNNCKRRGRKTPKELGYSIRGDKK